MEFKKLSGFFKNLNIRSFQNLIMALNHIGYIVEAIGTFAALYSGFVVYKKNKEYIGNRLLSLSMVLIGTYIGSILTYDLIRQELIIQIFFRIAISALLLGIILLYFSMQVMVHSSAWLENKKTIYYLLGFWLIYSLIISFTDVIEIIDLSIANTQMDLPYLIVIVFSIIILLLSCIFDLYLHGIRHAEKSHRANRWIFLLGLVVALLTIFVSVLSAIVSDEYISQILDVITFLVLALSQVLIALGFSRKPKV